MSKSIPDVPADLSIATVRQFIYSAVACDVLDALGLGHQSPRVQFLPQTGCKLLVGRCKTTLWADMSHEDPRPYELELRAVDGYQADDVVIAAAGGSMRSGIWGELLSCAARNSGCVGAIVDGAVRDVEKMSAMGFAVFARGRCVYDSRNRQRVVDIDVPIEIDGIRFAPGDLVIADMDGIVVIPQKVERDVLAAAWKKVHAENTTRDAIKAGMKASAVFAKYGVL